MAEVMPSSPHKSGPAKRHRPVAAVVVEHSGLETGAPEAVSGNGGAEEFDSVHVGRLHEYDGDRCEGNTDETKAGAGGLGQSPRYEAYLMTGEKMVRLDSKISPNYAKLKQAELPRHTEILDSLPSGPRGPFADLDNLSANRKSKRRQHLQDDKNNLPMPPSQSENGLASSCSTAKMASVLATVSNEQQPSSIVGAVAGDCREPSLVTVHGFNGRGHWKGSSADAASDTDHSRSTLQSTEFAARAAAGTDLPSPTSPSYYSEPVSPARFAFAGGNMPSSADSPRSNRYTRIQKENGNASPCSPSRAERDQNWRQTRVPNADSPAHVNGNTLVITVSGTAGDHGPVTGATSSDSDSPGASVHSTPLKERMQRFEAASRTSSSSTTAKELDAEAARRLAKRLYTLEGFRRSDVAKHLVKNNEFSSVVAVEYLKLFNFAGLRIDAALRKFLHDCTLTGETADREKILSYFSKRYYECNPGLFSFEDEVHTLTCALLLLHTDLHSNTISKRMTCHDFIDNLSHAGYTFPRDLLRSLYQSIKTHPIDCARERSESDTSASAMSTHAIDNKFLEMPDPDSQVEYKKGWVMRKCVIDEDGKPMPFGRRSWRMFYATLKGMVLYLHKDEHGFKKSSYQTFRNAVRIHHALASRASDYIKKQHVFRLHTAGLAEYLFQTSDPKEMQSWIDAINFVAACFSAPALPPAVSARQSFHRPLLPTAPTKLSMKEQCDAHLTRIKDLEKMLDQHRNAAPARTAKPRLMQDYAEKEIFLLFDLQKYKTYAQILRSRVEDQWERTAWTDMHGSTTTAVSEETTNEECGNGSGCLSVGTGGGRYSAQSGQSDRLSYRAAIASTMRTNTSTVKTSYETNL